MDRWSTLSLDYVDWFKAGGNIVAKAERCENSKAMSNSDNPDWRWPIEKRGFNQESLALCMLQLLDNYPKIHDPFDECLYCKLKLALVQPQFKSLGDLQKNARRPNFKLHLETDYSKMAPSLQRGFDHRNLLRDYQFGQGIIRACAIATKFLLLDANLGLGIPATDFVRSRSSFRGSDCLSSSTVRMDSNKWAR